MSLFGKSAIAPRWPPWFREARVHLLTAVVREHAVERAEIVVVHRNERLADGSALDDVCDAVDARHVPAKPIQRLTQPCRVAGIGEMENTNSAGPQSTNELVRQPHTCARRNMLKDDEGMHEVGSLTGGAASEVFIRPHERGVLHPASTQLRRASTSIVSLMSMPVTFWASRANGIVERPTPQPKSTAFLAESPGRASGECHRPSERYHARRKRRARAWRLP